MIKKEYLKDNETCNVIFSFGSEAARAAKEVSVVGQFNDWDAKADPMKRQKDGSFRAKVKLRCGESYPFRYLINGSVWENDEQADRYVPTPFGDSDDSVIDV